VLTTENLTMRKETQKIAQAFARGQAAKAARTETDGRTVWLHGNRIAQREDDGSVWVTLAGWGTVTTRERLNGICQELGIPVRFCQRNYSQRVIISGALLDVGEFERVTLIEGGAA
jgi:hypothetical protein